LFSPKNFEKKIWSEDFFDQARITKKKYYIVRAWGGKTRLIAVTTIGNRYDLVEKLTTLYAGNFLGIFKARRITSRARQEPRGEHDKDRLLWERP